jgi:Ca2+-transporting ATPase
MTLALAQTFHLGNARSVEAVTSLRRALATPHALGAVAISVGLQLAAMYVELLAGILHVTTLVWAQWIVVIGLSAVPALAGQGVKRVRAGSGRVHR